MKNIFINMFIAISLFFAGCGYTTSSLLPDNLEAVYVQNFTNKISPAAEISNRRTSYSYRPGIENDVTRAVIDAFMFDRNLKVEKEDAASLTLKGTLVDFRQYPLSYSDNDDVEEFRMEVYVDVELYDNSAGKLMWKEERFMGQTSYAVGGPNRKTEAEAQRAAVKDLARRIVERTVNEW